MKHFYLLISLMIYITSLSSELPVQTAQDTHQFYFCTAANDNYYPHLINLIGSIHRYNFYQLGQIAVFDIGLLPDQLEFLSTIDKVTIHKIEETNSDIFTSFYTQPENAKPVPGWYSWKPVAIKQAFDLFPQNALILWIDAGTTVLKDISLLFKSIQYQGYFFHNGWDWPLKRHTTQFLINALNLNNPDHEWILADNVYGLEAGLMGLTHKVYECFIVPMYEHTKDLRYFADDGTAPEGFGYAHHDQTLFSIYAHLNKFSIINHFEDTKASFELPLLNSDESGFFHVASLSTWKTKESSICCSRNDLHDLKNNVSYIYYRNGRISQLRKWYHSTKSKISELLISSAAAAKVYLFKFL